MSNLVQNFSTKVKGMISDQLKVSPGASLANVKEILLSAASTLSGSEQGLACFATSVCPLMQVIDYSSSESVLSTIDLSDQDIANELDPDGLVDGQSIYESLVSWITYYGVSQTISGWPGVYSIFLTDATGRVYQMVYSSDGGPAPQGFSWRVKVGNEGWYVPFLTTDGTHYIFKGVAVSVNNVEVGFLDLLDDLVSANELDSALLDLVDVIMSIDEDATALVQQATSWISSNSVTIKTVGRGLLSALSTGGIYGAVMYLISYFQSLNGVTYDDDGLVFTDNTGLIPSIWIAGAIGAAIGSIASCAALIAGNLFGTVGMVLTGAAVLGTQIAASWKYAWENETLCGIVPGFTVGLAAAPFAYCQYSYASDVDMDDLYIPDVLKHEGLYNFFRVPGGFMLASVVGGVLKTEFHPDLVDRVAGFNSFAQSGVFYNSTDQSSKFKITIPVASGRRNILVEFMQAINNGSVSRTFENESGKNCVASADDGEIRVIVATNIAIFFTYQILLSQITSSTPLSDVYVTGNGSGTSGSVTVSGGFANAKTFNGNTPEASMFKMIGWALYNAGVIGTNTFQSGWTWNDIVVNSVNAVGLEKVRDESQNYTYLTVKIDDSHFAEVYGSANNPNFYDQVLKLPSRITWAIQLPKYDRQSFWVAPALVAVTAVTVFTISMVATVKFKKWRRQTRFRLSANAERLHSEAVANPTAENIQAYDRAALKNNAFATIFGGTKISRSGFWASDSDSAPSSSDTGHANRFYEQLKFSSSNSRDTDDTLSLLKKIIKLIDHNA